MRCEIHILSGRKDFTEVIYKGNSISRQCQCYCAEKTEARLEGHHTGKTPGREETSEMDFKN